MANNLNERDIWVSSEGIVWTETNDTDSSLDVKIFASVDKATDCGAIRMSMEDWTVNDDGRIFMNMRCAENQY